MCGQFLERARASRFARRAGQNAWCFNFLLAVITCLCLPGLSAQADSVGISGVGIVDGVVVTTFTASNDVNGTDPGAFSIEREFSVSSQPPLPPGTATAIAYADVGGTLKLLEQAAGQAASIAGAEFRINGHLSGPTIDLSPYGWSGNGWVVGVSLDVHGTLTADPNESVVTELIVGTGLQGIFDRQVITVGGDAARSLTGVAISGVNADGGLLSIFGSLNSTGGGTSITNGSASFQNTAHLRFDLPPGVSFTTDSGVVFIIPGDYNNNGTVDAADYVLWRNSNGPSADYNTWRANFGPTAGSGSVLPSTGPLSAIPEPTTAVLLLVAASWCLRRRRAA
jgi:hypothetical protein